MMRHQQEQLELTLLAADERAAYVTEVYHHTLLSLS